ncbi:MAG: FAD-binding oxidoreductase [Proteobacteria bacterium]|nr:FAD-binding oxidoreductase [Pseudomonadota bacterium]
MKTSRNEKVIIKVVIIGAGVIGATCALTLQQDGHNVILVDRDSPCSGASFGNAGGIVNGSVAPTAMPGVIFDAVKMLGKPLSPLSIRAAYLFKISPWLLRFAFQSKESAVNANAKHLYTISQYAVESWKQLTNNTSLSALLRATGWLKVFETDQSFNNAKQTLALMDKFNSPYEILNTNQIHDLEPNLAQIFKHGFYQEDSISILNPEKLVKGMVDLFVSRGGTYQQFAVNEIAWKDGQVKVEGVNGTLTADKAVVCAGSWSKPLAKQLGDTIPLDTERGYHFMFPESTKHLLSRPILNGENSFVLSPMEMGMRMTSQVEFGGLKLKPDYEKIRRLLPLAKRMLPKLDTREESVWMGFRPSLPDSLPVIGYSKQSNNIVYAFGHQHLGMTLGAITGYVVSDIVGNRQPRIPIEPYRADRF